MTDTAIDAPSHGPALDEPVVVVTIDGHVAPPLEAYRPYCPEKYLGDFDELVRNEPEAVGSLLAKMAGTTDPEFMKSVQKRLENLKTDGHLDVHARLRDMDHDGVAGEVIFHGTPGGGRIPWAILETDGPLQNFEHMALGRHMYNRWLADFCSVEPERHVGLAQLPMWDIEASLEELKLAAELGLKGVNLPSPRQEITPYEDPSWDPFWSACEDLGMVLANHGGGGVTAAPAVGPAAFNIYTIETVTLSRVSPVVRFVYGGVFERHPKLMLVQTEQPGWWLPSVLDDLDSQYMAFPDLLGLHLPKLPSEYCRTNYFVGASFQSRFEAEGAVRDGLVGNIMWGSDYPHPEGTYHYFEDPDAPSMTKLAMRSTYAGLPNDAVTAMLGQNAVRVYGFDRAALENVAERISAPTLAEIAEPLVEDPQHWTLAFRRHGSYH